MALVDKRVIEGQGTTEAQWLTSPGLAHIPVVSAATLVPPACRMVVVAPHPDDEILMVGGLLQYMLRLARNVLLVAVTDGTASHADSTDWSRERLARERPRESHAALKMLGLLVEPMLRLGLTDGELKRLQPQLAEQIAQVIRPRDVVVTTWRHDGHPDHEATGHACAAAAAGRVGATLIEVPVWAWHWARPDDARLPWHRARQLVLDDAAVQRKQEAVKAFVSQLLPDLSTGAGPVLRSTTVARAARSFEMVFV